LITNNFADRIKHTGRSYMRRCMSRHND